MSNVLVNKEKNGVATVILNRPEIHNAFDEVTIQELTDIFTKLGQDSKVHMVILAANGKSFSAGADINWMQRMVNYSSEKNIDDSMTLARLMETLNNLKKPTLAIVQGAAFGGGIGLIACCDIAIAAETAIFCFSEVKIGIIPAVVSPYIIAKVGESVVRRYFLTAENFNANEAKQFGLIHEVVAPEFLETAKESFIKKLLNNGQNAIATTKQVIMHVTQSELSLESMEYTTQKIAEIRVSPEGQEGLNAFLEKRKPQWIDSDAQ